MANCVQFLDIFVFSFYKQSLEIRRKFFVIIFFVSLSNPKILFPVFLVV